MPGGRRHHPASAVTRAGRAGGGVGQHAVRTLAGKAGSLEMANVPYHHAEARGGLERAGKNLAEIGSMPRREVVDTDNCLAEREQFLE